jgi:hypothetical protein
MYSIVETRGGRLRGHFSDGISAFKGVRFAEPPRSPRTEGAVPNLLNPGMACRMRSCSARSRLKSHASAEAPRSP